MKVTGLGPENKITILTPSEPTYPEVGISNEPIRQVTKLMQIYSREKLTLKIWWQSLHRQYRRSRTEIVHETRTKLERLSHTLLQ